MEKKVDVGVAHVIAPKIPLLIHRSMYSNGWWLEVLTIEIFLRR
jgi:hypothetical protein